MEQNTFVLDWRALAIALCLLGFLSPFYKWSKRYATPHIRYSNVDFPHAKRQIPWVQYFLYLALFFLFLAFVNPYLLMPRESKIAPNPVSEGVAIYLILDHSRSMSEKVGGISRIDILKQLTRDFIQGHAKVGLAGRPHDLIGIVTFARSAQVLVPLTLDHREVINQLNQLQATTEQAEEGTSIGYAIFKTANILSVTRHYSQELKGALKPSYDIESAVMILITDGMQEINPSDEKKRFRSMEIPEAAEYAKDQGIRLYIININPQFNSAQYEPHRHQMERAAESTGGRFFIADRSAGLAEIYREIDKLEKSKLPVPILPKEKLPNLYKKFYFYPFLITFGMFFLFLAILVRSVFVRTLP